jgi:hypothetical protein
VHKGPPAQKAPEPEKHLVHDENDEVEYSDWMVAFYEHECGFDEWKSRQDEEEWIEKCRGADESRRDLEIKAWKRYNSQEGKDFRQDLEFRNWLEYNSEIAKEFRRDLKLDELVLEEEYRQWGDTAFF